MGGNQLVEMVRSLERPELLEAVTIKEGEPKFFESFDNPTEDIKLQLDQLTSLSQNILKEAWEKMKKEAQKGKAVRY